MSADLSIIDLYVVLLPLNLLLSVCVVCTDQAALSNYKRAVES